MPEHPRADPALMEVNDPPPVLTPPPCAAPIRDLRPASGQGRAKSAVKHFVPASNQAAPITHSRAVTCAAHVFHPMDERSLTLVRNQRGQRIMKDHLPHPPMVRVSPQGMGNLFNKPGKENFNLSRPLSQVWDAAAEGRRYAWWIVASIVAITSLVMASEPLFLPPTIRLRIGSGGRLR